MIRYAAWQPGFPQPPHHHRPTMMGDVDVAVVGAGPGGAAAAARLANRGVRVVLLDQHAFPRDKVCGDFVGPVALAELADLGLARFPGCLATQISRGPD